MQESKKIKQSRLKKKTITEFEEERQRQKQKQQQQKQAKSSVELNENKMEEEKKPNDLNNEDDQLPTFKIKKKKKVIEEQEKKKIQDEIDKQKKLQQITIKPPQLHINKTFQEIMLQARNPSSLAILKNNLSICNKQLQDKKQILKKQWINLKNSNLSQIEYQNRQQEIEKAEVEEIEQIKLNTIQNLLQADIKGFDTIENIIEDFRRDYFDQHPELTIEEKLKLDFKLEEEDKQRILYDQILLLQKIMKEKNLISNNVIINDQYNQNLKNPQIIIDDQKVKIGGDDQEVQNNSNLKIVCLSKYFEETSDNYNNQYSKYNRQQQQQQQQQQLQQEQYNKVQGQNQQNNNNNNDQKDIKNKDNNNSNIEIEDGESRSLMERVFQNYDNFIKVTKDDYFILQKRKKALLLDLKSDELFTDSKYQKEQYDKYTDILRQFSSEMEQNISEEQLLKLVEITAYIINNVHYYKKFKLDCDLIHPLDLLYIIERVEKNEKNR